jgi:flagellar hook-associated protein FlgK
MIRNNPNELVNARDRMMQKLDMKMSATVGHRGDMHIGDFKVVDQNGGHLLIGYEKSLGPVGSNDVIAFVNKTFDGKLVPIMETAKQYRAEGAVAVMLHKTTPTRKIEDKDQMLCIANTMFLDQALGDTWEVKAQPDGTKYLARLSKDNIGDIVSERRRRMSVQASTVTFGTALSAGVPNLNKGDTVKFYDGGKLFEGKVTGVGADVKISSSAGSFTVMPEAVVEILQVSPETTETIKSYLGQYFADAYGFEDYAKELTDRLI